MQIEIKNCNNIDSGVIEIRENHLNIKYAINGTGKSTISKAICNSVWDREKGTEKLSELQPFKGIGNDTITPTVTGAESVSSVKVFDETYINDFTFKPDELLKGSFDILIRDADYDAGMNEIENLVSQVKTLLSEDQDIEKLINDFDELSRSFGKSTSTGTIHGSSLIAKALKQGNKVTNIPNGLEIYENYIRHNQNINWIKWQLDGNNFIDIIHHKCPYCVNDIATQKETIKKVGEIYEVKTIENLNKIIAVFQRLNRYFSNDTQIIIDGFIKNVDGYTDDQVGYLKEVKDQVDRLNKKLCQAKNIGFSSLKDVDKVIEQLRTYKIEIELYPHLQSQSTLEKVTKVNESIEQLLQKAGVLQGKINIQKKLIEKLVKENKDTINSFLRNAGYRYEVDLMEDEKGHHKLKLIHIDFRNKEVGDVKSRLSYGERNAFALVLFMFDALKSQPDIVVLDDPISSFDKNKKYAIVEMLFKKEKCFKGKTVLLLSHDFEPIVDMLYHHSDRFQKLYVTFLENNCGTLTERNITKSDIQTFIEINETNVSNEINIVNRLVYLRRIYEITNARDMGYQVISNVLHKRCEPTIFNPELLSHIPMTSSQIDTGNQEVKQKIPEFDYQNVMDLVSNDSLMKNLYNESSNNYEKLHIYRIIFDGRDKPIQSDTMQKFINQAFHIENDYIYQLNPTRFQTVPQYVIDECDRAINEIQ